MSQPFNLDLYINQKKEEFEKEALEIQKEYYVITHDLDKKQRLLLTELLWGIPQKRTKVYKVLGDKYTKLLYDAGILLPVEHLEEVQMGVHAPENDEL